VLLRRPHHYPLSTAALCLSTGPSISLELTDERAQNSMLQWSLPLTLPIFEASTMGIDFSHGDVHFGFFRFDSFRRTLAAAIGIDLTAMEGHGGASSWDSRSDPLVLLLRPKDVEISIPPAECNAVADRLYEVVTSYPPPEGGWNEADWSGLELVLALREASVANQSFRSF